MYELRMKIEAKEIIGKILTSEGVKGRVNIYISKDLWTEFQSVTGKASASRVVEELMKLFIQSSKRDVNKEK